MYLYAPLHQMLVTLLQTIALKCNVIELESSCPPPIWWRGHKNVTVPIRIQCIMRCWDYATSVTFFRGIKQLV